MASAGWHEEQQTSSSGRQQDAGNTCGRPRRGRRLLRPSRRGPVGPCSPPGPRPAESECSPCRILHRADCEDEIQGAL